MKTKSDKLKILLADDHSLMRMGLAALISSEPDMCVVGEADDGEKTVLLSERLQPDVIIMDLLMPVVDGAEATRRIHDAHPEIAILILTSFGDSVHLLQAITNGASGALLKESPTDRLVDAIHTVARGKRAVAPDVQRILDAYPTPPSLTDRQIEILTSVARGFSSEDIARQFDISVSCVKHHVDAIMLKLDASTRSEAVAIAVQRHIISR